VTGAIILAKIPLHRQDILHLLDVTSVALDHIFGGLRSVLDTGPGPLRFTHQSFVDFLMDSEGPDSTFLFDKAIQSRTLLLGSLRVMKEELRFNICKLESSHVVHDEIRDLKKRVDENISVHLRYACRFWTDHIVECDFKVEIAKEVERFMTSEFLYWLEVMSLVRKANRVTQGLRSVLAWSKAHHNRMSRFMADALKFVTVFATQIAQSVPHIYLSAIVFAPKQSITGETFRRKYMNTVSVKSGKAANWPVIQNIFHGHSDPVESIAFSPDGSRIVSGSSDKTIRLWDAETGDPIGKPLEGHSSSVNSVGFSPDGSRIVSGSFDKTIRLWDAATGDPIGKPLEGHSSRVDSVAFSPDGSRIVSGSWDKTIRLWDAETGDPIGKPLEGHSSLVNSVAFSPDGSRIVSGSDDSTIRLWDSGTGDAIGKSLEAHSGKTIHLWDAELSDIVSTSSWPGYSQLLLSGWVVNSDAERLLWIPIWNRAGLCFPRNTMTISRDGASTLLDLSRFVHGTAWEKCRTG